MQFLRFMVEVSALEFYVAFQTFESFDELFKHLCAFGDLEGFPKNFYFFVFELLSVKYERVLIFDLSCMGNREQ
jgi:hypothetical protein